MMLQLDVFPMAVWFLISNCDGPQADKTIIKIREQKICLLFTMSPAMSNFR